jgi:hypothetical protein
MATGQPYYEENSWANKSPLKSVHGNERAKTVVIASSTVVDDTKNRKRLSPGSFLVKITSGHNNNAYGPYLKTASDGRQSPAEGNVIFTVEAHDVTLGDRAAAGYYAQCVFDKSELTMGGYSLHGTPLTNIKTYFPSCVFDD